MAAARFALVLALGLLSACGREPEPVHHRIGVFGTEVTVTIRADSGADTTGIISEIDRELQRMHRRWHAWEPGLLTDINRAIAAGRRIELSPDAIAVIEEARGLEARSGGRFNPAIGRLLDLWGFHASELPEGPPPPEAAIAELVERAPSLADLVIAGGRLSSANPVVQLDFNAYIKGVAVERALGLLRENGFTDAIVNAGGDLGVIGRHGDRPWRAAVQHPDGQGGHYLAGLDVEDGEFVFTSGNYRRYRQGDGIRHGHIIDPRDGYPADHVSSVTVIHESGGEADAAATALTVAGPDEWLAVARDLGVDRVMRVEADGRILLTPAMADRIRWQERPGNLHLVAPDRISP